MGSANEKILEMSTSNLFTVIRMASGSIYWWGIMPYEQRAKLLDKYQSKAQKSKSSSINEITLGSYVSLKALPLYNIGSIGFCVKDGIPMIGQINEHIFSYRDSKPYRFKVKNVENFRDNSTTNNTNVQAFTSEMPPPPSPSASSASSILEYQAVQNTAQINPAPTGSLKRKKHYSSSDASLVSPTTEEKRVKLELNDEESWYLNDVVFIEDSKASSILGKVVKIDSDYVLVKMQSKSQCEQSTNAIGSLNETEMQTISFLDNLRIFQINQLQLIRSSSNKLPDFIQKSPKKLPDFGNILSLAAQQNSIHAIVNRENCLCYVQYDLFSNKLVKEKRFPTNIMSLSQHFNTSLYTIDNSNFNIMTLIDGNSTFYPIIDLPGSLMLKDPQWKNIFPVKCFSQCLLTTNNKNLPNNSSKKLQFVTLFTMKVEQIMACIFRSDLNKVNKILRQIENEIIQLSSNVDNKKLKQILNERTDGNRNILHAAVYCCAPTSNSYSSSSNSSVKLTQSDNIISDVFNTYGTNSNSTKSQNIERPWSNTSYKSTGEQQQQNTRKINISLDSIQPLTTEQSSSDLANISSNSNSSATFWPPLPFTSSSTTTSETNSAPESSKSSNQGFMPVKLTDKERKQNAIKILQLLLESPLLTGRISNQNNNMNYLFELMTHKNAEGATPFMYAVNIRAYDAALILFDTALKIRDELTQQIILQNSSNQLNFHSRDLLFTNMIFPLGSRTDQSPLYVLCSNDTCSFTWTGDNHITQDIFECRTCTLVGNLCCCTECARTCHKGHDCKIKASSPTAYCDCWEKCKCKSLIAGDQEKRFKLLDKLLIETNLLTISNNKSESLLIYLVQTVGRQIQEQKNYKRHVGSSRRTAYTENSSSNSSTGIGDMPQHDLDPPKFCRRALERVFSDWYSIKQIFLFNSSNNQVNESSEDEESEDELSIKKNKKSKATNMSSFFGSTLLFDDSIYVDSQSGCIDLDKFIYILLVKCPNELLITLVETIQKKMNNSQNDDESKNETFRVIKRFIRSVVRLFVVLCLETPPSNLQLNLNLSNSSLNEKHVTSSTTSPSISHSLSSSQLIRSASAIVGSNASINSKLARLKSLSNYASINSNLQSSSTSHIASLVTISPIAKCEYVIKQFSEYALDELADAANSLITPVILGVSKPTTYKISMSTQNSSTNNEFNNNFSLAEELFNLEPPLHRQFASAISTTLIIPSPSASCNIYEKFSNKICDKSKLKENETGNQDKNEPSFINTFESIDNLESTKQKLNKSSFQSDTLINLNSISEQTEEPENVLLQTISNNEVSQMPPPSSSENQQLNFFAESDNNSNSSSNSSKSRASSESSRGGESSKRLDITNSSSDSSSETNSNDTAFTTSSTSTNTRRSTTALKNGRSGRIDSNKSSARSNFDAFSFILSGRSLTNQNLSQSALDINFQGGEDSLSSSSSSAFFNQSEHSRHRESSKHVKNKNSFTKKTSRDNESSIHLRLDNSNRIKNQEQSDILNNETTTNPNNNVANNKNNNKSNLSINNKNNKNKNSINDLSTNQSLKIDDSQASNLTNENEGSVISIESNILNQNAPYFSDEEDANSNDLSTNDEDDEEEINDDDEDDENNDNDEDDNNDDEQSDDDDEDDDDDDNDDDFNNRQNIALNNKVNQNRYRKANKSEENDDFKLTKLAESNKSSNRNIDTTKINEQSQEIAMDTNLNILNQGIHRTNKNDHQYSEDTQPNALIETNSEEVNQAMADLEENEIENASNIKNEDIEDEFEIEELNKMKNHKNNYSTDNNDELSNKLVGVTHSSRNQHHLASIAKTSDANLGGNQNNNIKRTGNLISNLANTSYQIDLGLSRSGISSTSVPSRKNLANLPILNNSNIKKNSESTISSNIPGTSTQSSNSSINPLSQQYSNSIHPNEHRVNIVNSLTSQPSIQTSAVQSLRSHHLNSNVPTNISISGSSANIHPYSVGSHHHHQIPMNDYYYAHNLMNINSSNNSISNSNIGFNPGNNNQVLIDNHMHQHHSTNTSNSTVIGNNASGIIPTSNTGINSSSQIDSVTPMNTPSSITITNNTLARVFSILLKIIKELVSHLYQTNTNKESDKEIKKKLKKIILSFHEKIDIPWQWLVSLMDTTEAQLRFGLSLSGMQSNENNSHSTQYLRHLEERALLTNYFNSLGNQISNSSNNSNGGYNNYYSNINVITGGPFLSRFNSSVDARRKLTIMQHQHQQFANIHSNQNHHHFSQQSQQNYNLNSNNSNFYHQQQTSAAVAAAAAAAAASVNNNNQTNSTNTTNNNNAPRSSLNNSSTAAAVAAAVNNVDLLTSTSSSGISASSSSHSSTISSQFSSSQIISNRKDFLTYTLSLMRSYTNEHRDMLPSIDISLLKHVAYVFDGFMFYLRSKNQINIIAETLKTKSDDYEYDDEDDDDDDSSSDDNDEYFSKKNYFSESDNESELNDSDMQVDSNNYTVSCFFNCKMRK